MNERMHRYLDGELRSEALTHEEREEVAQCEHFIRETGQVYRSIKVPDLSERIMSKLAGEIPANSSTKSVPWLRTSRGVLSGIVHVSLGWLWTPRPIRLRPVYGILAVAVFILILKLPDVAPPLLPPIMKTAVRNADGERVPTKVFVQFRLDAPHASAVRLAGSFTGWKPTYTLQQVSSGVWSILIPLEPGVHDYAFVVDGAEWIADPAAPTVDDGFGGVNSRLSVLLPNGDSRL